MVLQRDLEVFGPRKLMVLFKNVFNTAKPKNQFYVYCAECKSIAEGKIIVQCSECQQVWYIQHCHYYEMLFGCHIFIAKLCCSERSQIMG
jgi:hypothetical protein